MKDARNREVPTIFVRYEDLVMNPRPELETLMKFFLNQSDLKGTNGQRRIEEVLALGESATQTYDLKDTHKKFCSAKKFYTDAQIEYIIHELEDMIYFSGYAKTHLDPDNLTGFFQFDKATDLKHEKNHKSYRQLTNSTIEWISQMNDEQLAKFQYQLSDPAKNIPHILHFWNSNKMCEPVRHNNEKKLYGRTWTRCE